MNDETPSAAAPTEETPPSRAWRRTAVAVPVLAVVALTLFFTSSPVDGARTHRQSAECRLLPVSWDLWLMVLGGAVAAVGSVGLHIGLRWYARAHGWRGRTRAGTVADSFAVLGWLAVLLTGVAVWLTVDAQLDYNAHHLVPLCFGLAVPGR